MLLVLLLACSHTPSADAGAAVYDRACSSCHGADGTAGVQVNGVPAADLTRAVPSLTDDQLEDAIVNGTGEMPPVALEDADLADCVAYLREAFPE